MDLGSHRGVNDRGDGVRPTAAALRKARYLRVQRRQRRAPMPPRMRRLEHGGGVTPRITRSLAGVLRRRLISRLREVMSEPKPVREPTA